MQSYLDMVKTILDQGTLKPNRTGIDTLSYFALPFRHDLADGFPLLTTKKMSAGLWNSLVKELLWFMSGENHVRNLREHTKIWDAWADPQGNLETAYGFYWRNFPHLGGTMTNYDTGDDGSLIKWGPYDGSAPGNFDQLGYCVEQLKKNPTVVVSWYLLGSRITLIRASCPPVTYCTSSMSKTGVCACI